MVAAFAEPSAFTLVLIWIARIGLATVEGLALEPELLPQATSTAVIGLDEKPAQF